MAKKREKPRREPTKRQLSRWQQERKSQRIIWGIGIAIIVAILAFVGGGWYISEYRPLHQTVITVNDVRFNMDYYTKMLRYYAVTQPSLYGLANQVVKVIERNELVRLGARELGIEVSNDAIDQELKSRNPPLSKDYRDVVRTELLFQRLLDEYFEKQVPVSAEQRQVMAMLLESEKQAAEVRARIEGGEDFGKLASELSLDEVSQERKGDLGWHPREVLAEILWTPIPGEYAFTAEVGILSEPKYDEEVIKSVGYWLIRVLEREMERQQAYVQAILLGSPEQAQEIKSRLEAGENFTALALEFSQLEGVKENEGDLGGIDKGTVSAAFDEFVFNPQLEINTVSQPIRDETAWTAGGYWLLKVLDRDDSREIDKPDRDILRVKALNDWGATLWDNPKYKVDDRYLDDGKKLWAVERALRGLV